MTSKSLYSSGLHRRSCAGRTCTGTCWGTVTARRAGRSSSTPQHHLCRSSFRPRTATGMRVGGGAPRHRHDTTTRQDADAVGGGGGGLHVTVTTRRHAKMRTQWLRAGS